MLFVKIDHLVTFYVLNKLFISQETFICFSVYFRSISQSSPSD